jgi:ABC-type nitrate/sulfonate/bicarbonate transport system permease component
MSVQASTIQMPDTASFAKEFAREQRARTFRKIGYGIGFPILLLLLWEGAVHLGLVDRRFFPAPSEVVVRIGELLANERERSRLLLDIGVTFQRLLFGYLIGAISGVAVGLAMGLSETIRYSMGPLVNAMFPMPKLAIFPLLIVIFGLGDPSKVALIALGVFFMTCLNTLSGVLYSNPVHREMAQAFRIPRLTRWFRIVIPSAMPSIVTGLKLGLGQALILVVSAEFVASQDGLGQFIWQAWQVLDVSRMFMGLVVIALTGGAAVLFGELLERRLIPWANQ